MANKGLIEAEELPRLLALDNTIVFFTSMKDPATGEAEPIPTKYVPRSVFFDFENRVCDPEASLPHTMPSADKFESEVRKMGVNQDSIVVVYDQKGLYSAPRVWWMFKAMGHKAVYVLNGGLPAWLASSGETTSTLREEQGMGDFVAQPDQKAFVDKEALLRTLSFESTLVVDARSSGRFNATAPEPRPGLRSGHIPGAKNLPFTELVDNGRWVGKGKASALFKGLPAEPTQHLVFSCGSGVTACLLALSAYECGYPQIGVYDGSWSEWGADPSLPISID